MSLAGYSHQNNFIKARPLPGATCEEVIKTSGNQKIRSLGWEVGVLRFWSQLRLENDDYTPAVWTGRKGGRGQALFRGSHFSTMEVCFQSPHH